jgi:phosphatidylserine synthase
MGLLAVFFAYQGSMRESYLFLIGAALFDKLDGALARRLGLAEDGASGSAGSRASSGAVLDDLSDAISFCVAPAWIFYLFHMGAPEPVLSDGLAGIISILYGAMGVARLVYFTLDKHPVPGFFKGMPTPAAALLVVAPLLLYGNAIEEGMESMPFWGMLSAGVMVAASFAMNLYPVRYIHIGRAMGRHPWTTRLGIAFMFVIFLTPYFAHVAFSAMVVYLFSPIWSRPRSPQGAVRKAEA